MVRAHLPTIGVTLGLSALAGLLLYLVWPTVSRDPTLVFPVLVTVLLGGTFVLAWISRRRHDRSNGP